MSDGVFLPDEVRGGTSLKNDLRADGQRLRTEQLLAIKDVDRELVDAAEQVALDHRQSNTSPHKTNTRAKNDLSQPFSTRVRAPPPPGYTHLDRRTDGKTARTVISRGQRRPLRSTKLTKQLRLVEQRAYARAKLAQRLQAVTGAG